MEKGLAELLAKEMIRQFEAMPLAENLTIPLDRERLAAILASIYIKEGSERMRFFSPLSIQEKSFYDNPQNARRVLTVMGVITNYSTKYHPGLLVRKYRKLGEKKEEAREKVERLRKVKSLDELNEDDIVLCRKIRDNPQIVALRVKSFEAGHKYSAFAEYSVYRPIDEEHKGGEMWWKMPLVFLPGADGETLKKVISAGLKYQIPPKKISDDWFVDHILD